jgi:redox-sensitive bicupin YhaK (pirin superfamily)
MDVIQARERDLGDFTVRRILPYGNIPMVGPFIFFDHMGPADFQPGHGIDVRPHPHINLATITYLFEGAIQHRDSLGSNQLIEPGAVNWMIAGKGIVHSERTPLSQRQLSARIHGIQCWIALPEQVEDMMPSFNHYESISLPNFEIGRTQFKLLLGRMGKHESPVETYSDLFYLEIKMPKDELITLPGNDRELAVYIVQGSIAAQQQVMSPYSMIVGHKKKELVIKALEDSHLMLLGGKPIGKRHIYWNFVSSSEEKIDQAKKDWASGPRPGSRFSPIAGDDQDYIPLPDEVQPQGTIM